MAAGGNMKKKGYAAGGVGMKKGYAAGGVGMKKKMMSAGGTMKKKMMSVGGMPMAKDPKTGKMMPSFAMDGVGKMAKGGSAMYKKGYAAGGVAMKKLFGGGYALSEKSGSKVKSRFSRDEDKTPMKRKSDYQKVKVKKRKTRSGISAKDNTSSSYNVATRSYPGAGVRSKSTTTSKGAETAAQKKARLAKAAKIKAAKAAKEKAAKAAKAAREKAKRDKGRRTVEPSTFKKVMSVLGNVKRPTARQETDAEMKARLLKEKKAREQAKKNKNKPKYGRFNYMARGVK